MLRSTASGVFVVATLMLVLCCGCQSGGAFPAVAALPSSAALPDPLVMFDGRPVRTPDDWAKRRQELQRLFEHYEYGYLPAPPALVARVECEDHAYLNGAATLREVAIGLGGVGNPTLRLLVVTPNGVRGPVPCFVGPNFTGNHTLVTSDKVALPRGYVPGWSAGQVNHRATEAGRGKELGNFQIEMVIRRGYAVATFYYGDVEPDVAGQAGGVRSAYRRTGPGGDESEDWGVIAAWAWGVSRAVDWLVTDERIDARRIAAVGHSRLGKAVLLAAAFDERIALVIPHQSGCGGAAPSRSNVGESVKQINTNCPHWFDAHFKEFNDCPDKLPFDQHGLIALVAPRPCLLTNAEQDTCANPAGQFQMLRAATAVYRLLGVEGLQATDLPPVGTLIDSKLGYWLRPGGHSMGQADWEIFLRYADKHFGVGRSTGASP